MSVGRTIQLFLVDGTPAGLRKATIHGWTGIVFVSGDSAFGALTARQEVDRGGVYILVGPDPEGTGRQRAYIGSANSVSERIRRSAEERDFWETAYAVVTSDDDISKGHAEYLEARLIEIAKNENRVILDNGTSPAIDRRRLPEADRANMEQFLANLRVILPVVGLDMLKPQPAVLRRSEAHDPEPVETLFEIRHKSGVQAEAMEEGGEFVVLEGSESLPEHGMKHTSYAALKRTLVEEGVLAEGESGRLVFTRSYAFRSPSAASAVILDRNSNGRIEWKVKGHDKMTYQDHQQAIADALEQSE